MNVITLLNEKGGVGKTTLATHIAAGLAMKGKRVLLIDADAQGNSTSQMGLPQQNGLYALLVQDGEWSDLLRLAAPNRYAGDSAGGQLVVLPSNAETRVIPLLVQDVNLLRERLEELREWADVVVIDTSPTPSMLHAMIYMATDSVLYPTECEMLSLEGLGNTVSRMENLNESRRLAGRDEVRLLGIQPVMYDVRTNAHDYGLSLLTQRFKRRVCPAIPSRTIWRDAAFARQTVFAYDTPDHKAKDKVLAESWALVERVEKGIEHELQAG